jgi:Domain of unknown function (DUF4328)
MRPSSFDDRGASHTPVRPNVPATKRRALSELGGRATLVSALLFVGAVVDVVAIGLTLAEIDLLNDVIAGRTVNPDDFIAMDGRMSAWAGVSGFVLIATVVAWCLWQHRGQSNLVALDRKCLEYTPGWAVGWWFVPIANLWKPFLTVRELWKASEPTLDGSRWHSLRTPMVLGWWWGVWIGGGLLPLWWLVTSDHTTASGLRSGDIASVAGGVTSIVSAFLAIAIVRHVTRRQSALAALVSDDISIPPMPVPQIPAPPIPPAP